MKRGYKLEDFVRIAGWALFTAFLVFGAFVGLYYGGFTGIILARKMMGAPVEANLLVRFVVFAGMVVGAGVGIVCNTAIVIVAAATYQAALRWITKAAVRIIGAQAENNNR